jgi:hypothetical protein
MQFIGIITYKIKRNIIFFIAYLKNKFTVFYFIMLHTLKKINNS